LPLLLLPPRGFAATGGGGFLATGGGCNFLAAVVGDAGNDSAPFKLRENDGEDGVDCDGSGGDVRVLGVAPLDGRSCASALVN
jgi:hypothetical protein